MINVIHFPFVASFWVDANFDVVNVKIDENCRFSRKARSKALRGSSLRSSGTKARSLGEAALRRGSRSEGGGSRGRQRCAHGGSHWALRKCQQGLFEDRYKEKTKKQKSSEVKDSKSDCYILLLSPAKHMWNHLEGGRYQDISIA